MTSPPPASPAFEVAAHSGGEAKRSYVRTMFAAIAQQWDLRLVPGHPVELQPLITLRAKHGMRMTIHTR